MTREPRWVTWTRGGRAGTLRSNSPESPGGHDTAGGAVDSTRWTIGDRLGGFAVLLPAEPRGPVVIATASRTSNVLQHCFPGALALDKGETGAEERLPAPGAVVGWDGVTSPLRPGSVALLIVDGGTAPIDALRPAVAPGGTVAILGDCGDHVVYPSSDHPEQVWRSGWPIPMVPGLVPQMRRAAGLWLSRWRRVPRLAVDGPERPTFADLVLADLAAATGKAGELVGIHTGGHTILRVRQPTGDVAVRLSFSDPDRDVDVGSGVVEDVPTARRLVSAEVARGVTCGLPWIATPWLPRARGVPLRYTRRRRWHVAEQLVEELQSVSTGATGRDWPKTWCSSIALLPDEVRPTLQAALEPLGGGLPTGWCHGDLWPGNVLLDGSEAAVIDWDNATRSGIQGLDWLLIEALKGSTRGASTVGSECVRIIDHSPHLGDAQVGGRRWDDWDRRHRVALACAAFLLYLRNRSVYDMGPGQLAANLDPVMQALRTDRDDVLTDAVSGGPTDDDTRAGRAARGALWLGASGIVVKGAQTVVLLVLAALLAPSALGVIAIGTLVMNVSAAVVGLGTSSALVFWQDDVRTAARSALSVALLMALGLTSLAWFSAPWLAGVLHAEEDGVGVIRGLTIVLPCYAVASITLELLRRDLAFSRRVMPDIVAASAGAVVAVVLAFEGFGVTALVIGQIVQGILTLVIAWMVGPFVWPGWNLEDARGLLAYGGHIAGGNMVQLVMLNVDYIIVARVLDANALGQYSLAFRLAYLPYLNVTFVICGAAYPYLCRLTARQVGASVERVIIATVAGLLPLCLGIALLGDYLILLGDKWAPAVPALRWLAVFGLLLSLGQLAQTALNSVGRPRISFQLRAVHLLALVAALVVLTRYGITQVAFGQALVSAGIAMLALASMRRHVAGLSLRRLGTNLTPCAVGSAVMILVVVGVRHVLPSDPASVVSFIVIGTIALAAYVLPVWVLGRADLMQTLRLLRSAA